MLALRKCSIGIVAVGVSMFASSAPRADGMPSGSPCCAPSWTGFYLGGGVGYGSFVMSDKTYTTATGIQDRPWVDFGGHGWLGTVTAGYDHQIGPAVLGAFVDFDWSGASGRISDPTTTTVTFGKLDENHAWSVGGRAGILPTAKTLVYVSGGYTEVEFDGFQTQNIIGTVVRSAKAQTYDGWFIGAGMETLLSHNFALRLEYRFSDYAERSFDRFIGPASAGVLSTSTNVMEPTTQTVRLELTYKFGRADERAPLK
jgi:outer membrane immunogenic protein